MSDPETRVTYARYDEWKGWDAESFMALSEADSAYFAREIGPVQLKGEKVLEIGFGNGNFLAWAGRAGAELYGTELSDQGRRLASQAGVTVLPVDLAAAEDSLSGAFALIVAFDVLEHLTHGETAALLGSVSRLLRVGGRFIARFPNGQSPFGGVYQSADSTHITVLSAPMLEQVARGFPLQLIAVGNDLGVVHGGFKQRMKQTIQNRLRLAVEALVKRLFGFDSPMGVNVTVTLERKAESA